MRTVRLLLLTTIATSLLAPAAASAATWSAPASISEAANDLSGADVAFDAHGRALATWPRYRWVPGTAHGHYELDGWRGATRAPGAASFGAERAMPTFAAGPVLYGVSRAVGLDQRDLGWNRCGQRTTLRARFFDSSLRTIGAPRTIVTSRGPGGDGHPALAASNAGIVLVAWGESRPDCTSSLVRAALRRPGQAGFGAPITLRGSGRPEAPQVAVGAGGDLLVAWSRRIGEGRTRIEARYLQAGHGWGPVQALGIGSVAGPVTAAVAQNGRAYVAWAPQSISESTGFTARIAVAVQPAGRLRFTAARDLERIATKVTYLPRFAPVLALAGTRAYLAWTGRDATWRVRVAQSRSDGTFGGPVTVSPAGSDALLGDLAALPDGTAAATWSRLGSESLPQDVWAAVHPAGAAFGAPEQVSDGTLRLPAIGIDPVSRRPTVVWPQRLGPQTSVSKITAFVRASARTE